MRKEHEKNCNNSRNRVAPCYIFPALYPGLLHKIQTLIARILTLPLL